MSATTPPVEIIPDKDVMSRLIEEPVQYRLEQGMIWENIFQLPTNKETGTPEGESLVWSKYAPTLDDVHEKGLEREKQRKAKKPEIRYVGFICAPAGSIRSIKNKRGHGFLVYHEPSQGIHHAELNYQRADGQELQKIDKNELKFLLRSAFSKLVPRSCTA